MKIFVVFMLSSNAVPLDTVKDLMADQNEFDHAKQWADGEGKQSWNDHAGFHNSKIKPFLYKYYFRLY